MGTVKAICISEKRGTQKKRVEQAEFVESWGIRGDAHAGNWHRQVSLLSFEKIQQFRERGADVDYGAFGENLVIEGYDFARLPLGTRVLCNEVLLEITQIGKECHSHCEIYKKMGECIMPSEGVFAVVLKGGRIAEGETAVCIPANLFRTIAGRAADADCILATVTDGENPGEQALWIDGILRWNSASDAFFSKHARRFLDADKSDLLSIEGRSVFCEKIGGRKNLVVCGAGHVSVPIIATGKRLGFFVTAIDDREAFAQTAERAGADEVYCESFATAVERVSGSRDTYFVIVTRGHQYDIECLRIALKKAHAYIGMMGSRKRAKAVKEQLRAEGVPEKLLEQIHAPIGIAIGAESPEEIAISVMAQIIQTKNSEKRIGTYDARLMDYLTKEKGAGKAMALCTIVEKHGSAPREVGTKMLVLEDGSLVGTIGGGTAEHKIREEALAMLREGKTFSQKKLELTAGDAAGQGMACGGSIVVILQKM